MERYSVLKERLKEPPIDLEAGRRFQFHEVRTVRKPKDRVVEQVETREKETYHQILMGSTTLQGRDYIKPWIDRRTTR
jgi:hypothetical protein